MIAQLAMNVLPSIFGIQLHKAVNNNNHHAVQDNIIIALHQLVRNVQQS